MCQGGLDVPPEVSSPGEAIDIEWARPLGVVHVAWVLWEALGIGEVLRSLESRGPRRAPHELALFTMVANRLAEPLSKLACYEYWLAERVYLPEAAALTLDHLYFALDFLDTHIEAIEREIFFAPPISSGPMWTSSSGIRPVCTLRWMTKTPNARPSVPQPCPHCVSEATTKKGAGTSHRWWWPGPDA